MEANMAIGMIQMWAGSKSAVPAGWLMCDGTSVSQTQYSDLYAAIGYSFGANATDGMFFLPDLRGRFIRGADDGSGNDPDADTRYDMNDSNASASGVGSVQSSALQDHQHDYYKVVSVDGSNIDESNSGGYMDSWNATSNVVGANTSSSETRAVNAALYFLIQVE
jgi:microcystin-dependent protein